MDAEENRPVAPGPSVGYQILQALARIEKKVDDLRAYVEKIETEAHEAMGGLAGPDGMMKMAAQFLGVEGK